MSRRYRKVPQEKLDELRRLLVDTDMALQECFRRADVKRGSLCPHIETILKESRRYISRERWFNFKTGRLHPVNYCNASCAARKTGLSVRTVWRRFNEEGVISVRWHPALNDVPVFDAESIATLKSIGKNPPDNYASKLDWDDVIEIRELARDGVSQKDIAVRFGVSRRHINRIVRGEDWKRG